MSCRFDDGIIVRNSYDGGWGREERQDNLDKDAEDNPIRRGKFMISKFLFYFIFATLC